MVILSLPLFQIGQLPVTGESHLVLVKCLRSLPGNSVDRLTDWLDKTLIVLNGP